VKTPKAYRYFEKVLNIFKNYILRREIRQYSSPKREEKTQANLCIIIVPCEYCNPKSTGVIYFTLANQIKSILHRDFMSI